MSAVQIFENIVGKGEIARNVFYSFGQFSAIFISFKLSFANSFSFDESKNLFFGKGLNTLTDTSPEWGKKQIILTEESLRTTFVMIRLVLWDFHLFTHVDRGCPLSLPVDEYQSKYLNSYLSVNIAYLRQNITRYRIQLCIGVSTWAATRATLGQQNWVKQKFCLVQLLGNICIFVHSKYLWQLGLW